MITTEEVLDGFLVAPMPAKVESYKAIAVWCGSKETELRLLRSGLQVNYELKS